VSEEPKNPDQDVPRGHEDLSLPPLLGEPEREDIQQIHQAILKREKEEPDEGLEPAPWWVWGISAVAIFAMGFYLGRYGGTFSPTAHELYQKASIAEVEAPEPAPQGDVIYSTICLPCHQAGGLGVQGKYPPLAGSEWLAKDPGIAVRIVLNGLQGPIQVKGASYSNEMPALGGQLSDAEIAAVLTFERSSWGNNSGGVDPALVSEIRKATANLGPWTAEKLAALPAAEGAAKAAKQ
jgi:mono/diheme cytochrome c family protein